jgi:hypothetical protein
MKPTTAACNNRNDEEEDYVAMKWFDDEKRIMEVDGDFIFLGAEEV